MNFIIFYIFFNLMNYIYCIDKNNEINNLNENETINNINQTLNEHTNIPKIKKTKYTGEYKTHTRPIRNYQTYITKHIQTNTKFKRTTRPANRTKVQITNMFGYEDYESQTIASFYYDAEVTTDINDRIIYDFTTKYKTNREMYRNERMMRMMNRGEARMIEEELYNRFGYTIDQIAELSGLTVARAIERHYKPINYSDVLVFAGSGNNGLYGMVCARHLKLMGYDPTVFLVNEYNKTRVNGYKLFTALKKQLLAFNIPIISNLPKNISDIKNIHKLYVDAIFGHNYERHKFDILPKHNRYKYSINVLKQLNKDKNCPIVSIDLPSGWDTNIGNYEGHHINPEMLVSLICPKLGVVEFFGKYHYCAGNYLPPILNEKYELYVPSYNGSDTLLSMEHLLQDSLIPEEMFQV